MNVGLACGGGGARGLAHLGVLKALQEARQPVNCISGTSMGAIVGACYAVAPNAKETEQRVRSALNSALFAGMKFNLFQDASLASKKTFLKKAREFVKNGFFHFVEQTRYSLFDREKLERVISLLLPDIDIADTTIPFACVATDLTHGKARVFTRGSLRTAVLASAAIPGIFPPVLIDGIYYNDGGAVAVTPVAAAKDLGADFVIASDVKSQVTRWEKPEKAGEIMARCHHITSILLNECHLKEADVILSPQVKLLKWYDFEKIDFLVAEGEQSVARKLWEIRARVQYRRMRNGVRRVGTWLFPGAFAPPDESNE